MVERQFTVYMASHPSKGVYIGVTTQSLASRASAHRCAAKRRAVGKFHTALRNTSWDDWCWKVIKTTADEATAFALERREIAKRATLNARAGGIGGGAWPLGAGQGGQKNRGRKMNEDVRAWFREFHRNRPRKRLYDRAEMLKFWEMGYTISEIARRLACDAALVSRVVRGIYKH